MSAETTPKKIFILGHGAMKSVPIPPNIQDVTKNNVIHFYVKPEQLLSRQLIPGILLMIQNAYYTYETLWEEWFHEHGGVNEHTEMSLSKYYTTTSESGNKEYYEHFLYLLARDEPMLKVFRSREQAECRYRTILRAFENMQNVPADKIALYALTASSKGTEDKPYYSFESGYPNLTNAREIRIGNAEIMEYSSQEFPGSVFIIPKHDKNSTSERYNIVSLTDIIRHYGTDGNIQYHWLACREPWQ